ncbi:MAG: hypothetical protein ACTSR8_10990 [Promethearchaeota archaeon]
MKSFKLENSLFEGDIFFILKDKKDPELKYGVIRLSFKNLKGILESIALISYGRPIPLHLQENLNNTIFPRFKEIFEFIEQEEGFPKKFGIEISNQNQEDLLYKLNIPKVKRWLRERGFRPLEIIDLISFVQFIKY